MSDHVGPYIASSRFVGSTIVNATGPLGLRPSHQGRAALHDWQQAFL